MTHVSELVLTVNGEARRVPAPATAAQLLDHLGLDPGAVVVEVNRRIVSVYGLFDPHIPGGSHLEGARNVQLGTRGHFLPLSDPRVHEAILEGIGTLTR